MLIQMIAKASFWLKHSNIFTVNQLEKKAREQSVTVKYMWSSLNNEHIEVTKNLTYQSKCGLQQRIYHLDYLANVAKFRVSNGST